MLDLLENLGMSEYAERFVKNDIDIEVLGELTDADFDRLGVSIGHRRKLLKALAAGIPTAAEASHSRSAADSAERTGHYRHRYDHASLAGRFV
jgi:hypothetical protein